MKVVKLDTNKGGAYVITSPATGQNVVFDERWNFNGDYERPTFRPSMIMKYPVENPEIGNVREHFFVTDGKIQYLQDCNHEMRGKTVEMIDCKWHSEEMEE